MKVGEIWDYLLRRKALLGLLLLVLLLGGVIGAKIMAAHRPVVSQAQEIGVGPEPTYNNSLSLRIPGRSGKTAYELVIASDFRSAKVTVTKEVLEQEAQVRILDQNGQLLSGEYTKVQDESYSFDNAANYTIPLNKGYIIEVQGNKIQVLSNLTYTTATAFVPSGNTERYVVMNQGLRKSTWSEAEGENAMYNLLKAYIVRQIDNYQAQLSDEVLNNKNLDVARKTQIVLSYRQLKATDQAPYRDFINHLRRGGVPQITYSGKREYLQGETVDFTKLVSARDGEDGEYTNEEIITRSEVNFEQPGEYLLAYTVSDSDRNKVTLNIPIVVAEAPQAELPVTPTTPEIADISNQSSANNPIPAIGGGVNSETDSTELIPTTVWDDQNDAEAQQTLSVRSDNEQSDQNSKPTEVEKKTAGFGASQIVLIVLGVVVLFGLIRFIFDHYVR